MEKNKQIKWKLNVRRLAEKQGIANPYGLWQKLGGSMETTAHLWEGTNKMIRLATINKLCKLFHCTPQDLFELDE